jgi:hypothetical protein
LATREGYHRYEYLSNRFPRLFRCRFGPPEGGSVRRGGSIAQDGGVRKSDLQLRTGPLFCTAQGIRVRFPGGGRWGRQCMGEDKLRRMGEDKLRRMGEDKLRRMGEDKLRRMGEDKLRPYGIAIIVVGAVRGRNAVRGRTAIDDGDRGR